MNQYVFVYGTLKSGYSNHVHISPMVEFVSEALLNNHKLYYSVKVNSFPVMRRQVGSKVIGELYKITDPFVIDIMDEIEGEGSMYSRKEVKVFSKDIGLHTAITYIGMESFWDFDLLSEITSDTINIWK